MDDIRALRADKATQRRQLTQIANNAFAGDAVADDLDAKDLEGSDLFLDKWRESAAFVGCDY
jgi:hypothetical protein